MASRTRDKLSLRALRPVIQRVAVYETKTVSDIALKPTQNSLSLFRKLTLLVQLMMVEVVGCLKLTDSNFHQLDSLLKKMKRNIAKMR